MKLRYGVLAISAVILILMKAASVPMPLQWEQMEDKPYELELKEVENDVACKLEIEVQQPLNDEKQEERIIDAREYGLLPEQTGVENSKILQELIDMVSSSGGGIIEIPAGVYYFAQTGTQTIGAHCVKMCSNVTIRGAGEATILKPVGESEQGLDMFYFNDYLDTGEAVYLENCRFENFVIDGEESTCNVYTSAGKGFMLNLLRNCHWQKVTVKNTDATGFGVDCPIDSSMVDCMAENCGKAATAENVGASGFGIGFGFSEEESFVIQNCVSNYNKKFGFFFEHQGRFNALKYSAQQVEGFSVLNCTAEGNLYNFGGIHAIQTVYSDCHSYCAIYQGYYFEDSLDSYTVRCTEEPCR